jgi:capsular exopolysaccharide synthesis family protein
MLMHGTPDSRKMRVLIVTSAISGEGKTTLAGHLAISLTRAGFRTLLIDGDMQAPSAHTLFDLSVSPGLSELLRGEVDVHRAVKSSPIPGLSILPAGNWTLATRQNLVGKRWGLLKRELESQFDFVVIDTSPLLLVTDTMLLAREADGVILSVLVGVSQVPSVTQTVHRLRAVGAELVGVVVNNVRTDVYRQKTGYRPNPLSFTNSINIPGDDCEAVEKIEELRVEGTFKELTEEEMIYAEECGEEA